VQHVGGDDRRGAAAVDSLAGCGGESFEGGVADVLAFGLGHRGEEREQDHPAPTDSQPRNLPSHIRPIFGGYYGDPDVVAALRRHRVQVPDEADWHVTGPFHTYGPLPVPAALVRELYVDIGLSIRHIALLIGLGDFATRNRC
jgi:hypothetical protein